ncbi:MAG: hypothetical protein KGN32_08085 [Burkholderiales bacterium]|nr:hypothetical protein [Burkholderiales bacterium]
MSPFLDSLGVCLGALNALRTALCIDGCLRPLTTTPAATVHAWQLHAMNVASGFGTVVYAVAGGSRDVLVVNVLIVTTGALVPLLFASIQEGAP